VSKINQQANFSERMQNQIACAKYVTRLRSSLTNAPFTKQRKANGAVAQSILEQWGRQESAMKGLWRGSGGGAPSRRRPLGVYSSKQWAVFAIF